MKSFYKTHNIDVYPTVPYTPQENGKAERINRTLLERTRAALLMSRLPPSFWFDALSDVTDKYNCTLHTSINSTPHSLYHGSPPSISTFLPFGAYGYATIVKPHLTKLEPRAVLCRYLRRPDTSHYVLLNLSTGKVFCSRISNFKLYLWQNDPQSNYPSPLKPLSTGSLPAVSARFAQDFNQAPVRENPSILPPVMGHLPSLVSIPCGPIPSQHIALRALKRSASSVPSTLHAHDGKPSKNLMQPNAPNI